MTIPFPALQLNNTSGQGELQRALAPHGATDDLDTAPVLSMREDVDSAVELCGKVICDPIARCRKSQRYGPQCICPKGRVQVRGHCEEESVLEGETGIPSQKISFCDGKPCRGDAECMNFPTPRDSLTCVCVHHLAKADADGRCPPVTPEETNNSSHVGVLHIQNLKGILGNSSSAIDNQTISILQPSVAHSESMLLQVVLPLGVLIFIAFLISLVCFRRHRQHRSKRASDSVVKNNDGALLLDRMNNINKNPTYFLSPSQDASQRKLHVREICMDHIVLVDIVGEGAFGQVFKGDLLCPDTNTQRMVAVKVLKENVSNEIREDFEREVEIMSAFDHDNILKLIGVVTQNAGQSPYMIFEYMVHGDLAELLRKNDPMLAERDTGIIHLQKTDLVDIATQIAHGMKYLTSQHFVHRDLATRNCLVGDGLVVKISDFGMSRDIYTCDYYKIGGSRMLPVRWMSPESVKYGRFTSESDAWAYGVVLWEIFSYGRQPYYGHSNEEVIRFLDAGILLQRPEDCPSTIYHVMLGCWKADPRERLAFDKIHMHLQDYHERLVRATAVHVQSPLEPDQHLPAPHVSPVLDIKVKGQADPAVVMETEQQKASSMSKPSLKVTLSEPKPRTQPLLPDLRHSPHRVQPTPEAQPRSEPQLNVQLLQADLCQSPLPPGVLDIAQATDGFHVHQQSADPLAKSAPVASFQQPLHHPDAPLSKTRLAQQPDISSLLGSEVTVPLPLISNTAELA